MKCPRDPDVTLLMSSREGIEIDYCPECRGVWLDRGELDKIIDRSDRDDDDDRDRRRDRDDDDRWRVEDAPRSTYDPKYDRRYDKDHRKKKRKSFFSELFDFD